MGKLSKKSAIKGTNSHFWSYLTDILAPRLTISQYYPEYLLNVLIVNYY